MAIDIYENPHSLKSAEVVTLPAEIWLEIFRIAASEPPAPFDTSPLPFTHSEERAWTHSIPWTRWEPNNWLRKVDQHYETRVRTRCSLVLVSKSWRTMAMPILFEYVVLRNVTQLRLFSNTLENDFSIVQGDSPEVRPSEGRHHGRFTKFLSIQCMRDYESIQEMSTYEMEAILVSFRLCTNLEVLHAPHSPFSNLSGLIADQIITNGCCLRYISRDTHSTTATFDTLSICSSLEALCLSEHIYRDDDVWTVYPFLTFPRLHVLDISSRPDYAIMRWLAGCNMPALRRLITTADVGDPNSKSAQDLITFYESHGSRLTSLNLQWQQNPNYAAIHSYCSSVQDITVHLGAFSNISPALPNLARIGIYVSFEWSTSGGIDARIRKLGDNMKTARNMHGPALKSMVLVGCDPANLELFSWTDEHLSLWREWIDLWKSEGVRFEFNNGQVVEVPRKK